jgi:hypothetical protein
MTKVIHVHLLSGRKNYYFGSISAIFDVLTPEQIGYTKSSLLHAGIDGWRLSDEWQSHDHTEPSKTKWWQGIKRLKRSFKRI